MVCKRMGQNLRLLDLQTTGSADNWVSKRLGQILQVAKCNQYMEGMVTRSGSVARSSDILDSWRGHVRDAVAGHVVIEPLDFVVHIGVARGFL